MIGSREERRFSGKVAVITGGASGIGLALAMQAAREGMSVALADLAGERLDSANRQVAATGARVIAVPTDVSRLQDVEILRDRVTEHLGPPWLIANNAGITRIALAWDHSEADWRRVIEINLFGVVNGLTAFLPGLRDRKEGYVLNTASAAGLLTIPAAAAYVASKHAVVGLSETLYRELRATTPGVGVSVLCPALVKTNIIALPDASKEASIDSAHALSPEQVANQVFDAIIARRFWILTHATQMEPYIRARADQAIRQRDPDAASVDPDVVTTASAATGVDLAI